MFVQYSTIIQTDLYLPNQIRFNFAIVKMKDVKYLGGKRFGCSVLLYRGNKKIIGSKNQ
jgi:hypothetical protein